MELYREDGRKAGLYDVCEWWIETYPPDVFVNEPKPIVEARMCMQNILIKRVKVVPSSNNEFNKVCLECGSSDGHYWVQEWRCHNCKADMVVKEGKPIQK